MSRRPEMANYFVTYLLALRYSADYDRFLFEISLGECGMTAESAVSSDADGNSANFIKFSQQLTFVEKFAVFKRKSHSWKEIIKMV